MFSDTDHLAGVGEQQISKFFTLIISFKWVYLVSEKTVLGQMRNLFCIKDDHASQKTGLDI